MLKTALHFSHQLLRECVQPGDIVVDATMGNGHDTLFLAELVGEKGQVHAFDIQQQALEQTTKRLSEANLTSRVACHLVGHEHVLDYLAPEDQIQAAIFNLGYLPNSDKHCITLPETTKQALDGLLSRLKAKGRIIVVSYYGHAGGAEELHAVEQYCQALPQESINVLKYQFINQKNQPPILFCIEKKRR